MSPQEQRVCRLLEEELFAGSLSECVGLLAAATGKNRPPATVAFLNPHSAVTAIRDSTFASALEATDLLLPDGIGVVCGARILGRPVRQRIAGMDVLEALTDELQALGGKRVFFLGSDGTTLQKLQEEHRRRFPGVHIAGSMAPPIRERFSEHENHAMLSAINAASPDVLWVGLGAPKQEGWVAQHKPFLKVGIALSVGAAFGFFAGTVPRASDRMARLGLEWLPRLLREPRRLWRRTILSAPAFVALVLLRRADQMSLWGGERRR